MSAVKAPKAPKAPSEVVTNFEQEYEAAILEARMSSEHTATEGWQRLYGAEMKAQVETRRAIAKELANAGERLELLGSTEDDEKIVGDLKKQMCELRTRSESFESRVVSAVRAPVDRCERVIDQAIHAARRQEDESPLHYSGLTAELRACIDSKPKASWDQDRGIVTVTT